MSPYDWVPTEPVFDPTLVKTKASGRRRHLPAAPKRSGGLITCANCDFEFHRARKTCPACLTRRERTDAA